MKKFLLTVTVLGLAGLSYASPCVKKIIPNKKIYGCYTQTITQYEDSQGNYVGSVAGPRVAAPCGEGQLEGSTKTTYVHQVHPLADIWGSL
ncbi:MULTISPECIES: hypothetical protein [unclassified Chryseobacterium]|jgi:hypothetical protein|uniref:hypothetical protein n=1 Tax=unclassified Chryseobacterium TaxID=2593645 RepID=UPI00301AE54F